MMTKQASDLDRLLGHARWVEGFSRALVREDSEDVAQDAWLAAIQHPPAVAASRPWFATVMRNLRRMRFRSASRRRAREEASVAEEAVPTPAELAQRMELQRRLASAVVALEEPQRSTIVLVFYEGLSPAEVARRQGVPATTVRSRVRAALVALRAHLDAEEGGDRARWHLALAPIAAPKLAPAGSTLVGPLALATAAVVASAIVVAVALRREPAPTGEPVAVAREAAAAPIRGASPPVRTAPAPAALALAGATEPEAATPFARAEKTLMKHVDECYEIARRSDRELRGIVQLTIALHETPRGTEADVEVDTARTTIADPVFLECVRENATAFEDHLARLREQGEPIEGPLTVHVAREMPPTAEATELVHTTADEGDTLRCPDGTALAGEHGTHQWCAQRDGTKHGPEWRWDRQGRVVARTSHTRGITEMEVVQGD